MNNLQTERSKFAFDKVCTITEKHKEKKIASEFRSLARSTPAKIQMTGLGTTIAFLFSKKEKSNAYKEMYELIEKWLQTRGLLKKNCLLMYEITKSDTQNYRLMTNEVQQLLIWVKRFSEGMIESDESK